LVPVLENPTGTKESSVSFHFNNLVELMVFVEKLLVFVEELSVL
jgi:hypothetical protein